MLLKTSDWMNGGSPDDVLFLLRDTPITRSEIRRRVSVLAARLSVVPCRTVGIAERDPVKFLTELIATLASRRTPVLAGGNRLASLEPAPDAVWAAEGAAAPAGSAVIPSEDGGDAAMDLPPISPDAELLLFTSGTTGNPKMAVHNYKYPLGHFITAKYWHCVDPDGLHLTVADTGWAKAAWGKLYGQWLCEGAVFVYDFDRFSAGDILPMFAKYNITTFCAPPTMLRMMIKEDLSMYDLSSIHHMTTAGEALNPEVARKFKEATGLEIMEGFGQTETTLTICNLVGTVPKLGSMGKASPQYDVDIVDADGNSVPNGEVGEIVIRTANGIPCGLYKGYYRDEAKTAEAWHDGLYHTGDTAWRDEDGYFWYVSRIDDVIKSSGYRIGPFEIESVIMELPYVLECGVSAAPDEVRGQIVKASIVLTKGTEPTEELKKEIQQYVKEHTAPYKYPRLVVFRDELPKTISGKIQRNKL